MWSSALCTAIAASMLTACASGPQPIEATRLPTPPAALAADCGALAAVAAALYGTGRVHQARVDHAAQVAEQLGRAQAVAAWLDRHTRAGRAIEAAHEDDRERIRTVFRTIDREVLHVVDRKSQRRRYGVRWTAGLCVKW